MGVVHMSILPYYRKNDQVLSKFMENFFENDFFFTEKSTKQIMCRENDTDYIYDCVVAGVSRENIDVSIENGLVQIKAEEKGADYARSYHYKFVLPENINDMNDSVNCKLDNGILTVNVKKKVKQMRLENTKIKVE